MASPLVFSGYVERGEGIATGLGCPTANVSVSHGAVIPGLGIYVGEAEFEGARHNAVIAVTDGRDGSRLKLEVHVLGQKDLEMLGKFLTVRLLEKRRGLVPWESEDQMRARIIKDLEDARAWFAERAS